MHTHSWWSGSNGENTSPPSKHYAHTTKRASMHKQKRIVFYESPIVLGCFMQKPTSDAHSNAHSINANFKGISYTDVYIHGSPPKPPCMLLSPRAPHPRWPHPRRPGTGVQGGATWGLVWTKMLMLCWIDICSWISWSFHDHFMISLGWFELELDRICMYLELSRAKHACGASFWEIGVWIPSSNG